MAGYLPAPLVALALVLDIILGDPAWIPHPVVLIGKAIASGERLLWTGEPTRDRIRGTLLACSVIVASAGIAWAIIRGAEALDPIAGAAAALIVAWTTLALRGLSDAAGAVHSRLAANDVGGARSAIPALVGRDPASLDWTGLIRAAVESIAENASDGVIAPLFFLFLGGPAAAIAYKAINTLDSMIGHRDQRYLNFGRAAARIDDAANFIPARLTAVCIIAASAVVSARAPQALKACIADARKHASPNAGYPEAAMAGALGVELGGDAIYQGEIEPRAILGKNERPLHLDDIDAARRMLWLATLIAFVLLACIRYLLISR